ncbi:2-methoxy-6-polyprenyl-1,4-benzoquinol methylase, mitochondrial [Hypsibius exemplaris]|uniref:2-methoxy-6-polyprenyl-1,4-benzoquinol methylase, mitochondrial n=1 Tax=Hypsibius exemplaris TaxID=2072580 RepID=A0A1W0WQJ4_HYPEX|nr:2-methoxy-6-polyprenyl-1,4-benzoquinol methylase, mitochondrial [Hypsibius exemplaris]
MISRSLKRRNVLSVFLEENCSSRSVSAVHFRRFAHNTAARPEDVKEEDRSATHFGFETVTDSEKTTKVHGVFEQVASTYDKMNDAMSFGIHRVWKDEFVRMLSPYPDTRILDVAGGTGDIAFRLVRSLDRAARRRPSPHFATQSTPPSATQSTPPSATQSTSPSATQSTPPSASQSTVKSAAGGDVSDQTSNFSLDFSSPARAPHAVPDSLYSLDFTSPNADSDTSSTGMDSLSPTRDVTVFDLSESMLEVGKLRALQAGLDSRIDWVHGNAEDLPFADDSFDAYTIAFGIRNVTHIERALDEAFRVLKPGGRFMCLEFSQVTNPLLAWFYEKYSFQVIPVMGQIIASDWKSYQYLVESIRMFPDQEEFLTMIEDSGFSGVTYKNLSQGICAIHSGFKL